MNMTSLGYNKYIIPYLQPDDYIIIEHNFTQSADMFSVTEELRNESSAVVTYNDNVFGDWFFDKDAKMLSYLGESTWIICHCIVFTNIVLYS